MREVYPIGSAQERQCHCASDEDAFDFDSESPYSPEREGEDDEDPESDVTCCIAFLCEKRRTLGMITDKMAGTVSDQSEMSFKIHRVHKNWRILTAGQRRSTSKIIGLVRKELYKIPNPTVSDVEKTVLAAYATVRWNCAINPYLRQQMWTLEEFQERAKQNPDDASIKKIQNGINNADLHASLLVCGFAEERGEIFCVDGLDEADYLTDRGFHAIGTGKRRALSVFHYQNFKKSLSLWDALFLAFQAKVWAEGARSVGKKTDVMVLRFNQKKGISLTCSEKKNLREMWQQTKIKKLDGVQDKTRKTFDKTIKRLGSPIG
jgi:hypothetical protein